MSVTLTVQGDVNSVDTKVLLTKQGSVSAPSLVTPANAKKIDKIIVAAAGDMAAAGDVAFFLRLGGNAVLNGEQVIAFGACGGETPQAGSDQDASMMVPFVLDDAQIDVRSSDTISIGAEMAGTDVGDTTVSVTLIFA